MEYYPHHLHLVHSEVEEGLTPAQSQDASLKPSPPMKLWNRRHLEPATRLRLSALVMSSIENNTGS
eukprot:1627435-Amphidinium_carterae.1